MKPGDFRGATLGILTQHGKEAVVEHVFQLHFGARVERIVGFDTDELGTFTRDVPRHGSQLGAAQQKASKAAALWPGRFVLASEGATSAGPLGSGCWGAEILLVRDRQSGREVVASASGTVLHRHEALTAVTRLLEFAATAGFPSHGLVVRPDGDAGLPIEKGLTTEESLIASFRRAQASSVSGVVFV